MLLRLKQNKIIASHAREQSLTRDSLSYQQVPSLVYGYLSDFENKVDSRNLKRCSLLQQIPTVSTDVLENGNRTVTLLDRLSDKINTI